MTVTLGRDDLVRIVLATGFFPANPAFAPLEPKIDECRAAYTQSGYQSSCGCGGDPRLLFNCLDAFLAFADELRTAQPAALQDLVRHIGTVCNKPACTSIRLYYRKTTDQPLRKVYFP